MKKVIGIGMLAGTLTYMLPQGGEPLDMDAEIIALKEKIGNKVCSISKLPDFKVSLDDNNNFILEVPAQNEGDSPKIKRTSLDNDEIDERNVLSEENFYKNAGRKTVCKK